MIYKSLCLAVFCLGSSMIMAQQVQRELEQVYSDKQAPGMALLLRQEGAASAFYTQGMAHMQEGRSLQKDTQFRLASVSKQFTAMAIYRLIREGKLAFHTPVREILPELPAVNQHIQIGHLLQHSSGIVDYESYIPEEQLDQVTDADVLSILAKQDTVYFDAGTRFRYSNSAYCLMALIVSRVSQQSFSAYANAHIFRGLGIERALVYKPTDAIYQRAYGYHPQDGKYIFADQSLTSATQGDGGVYISVQEYDKWIAKSNLLFDERYLADLEKHKILVKDGVYYSLGWFMGRDMAGDLYLFHSGESTGFHNMVLFNHSKNNALVAFSNRDDMKLVSLLERLGNQASLSFSTLGGKPLFQWLSSVYAYE